MPTRILCAAALLLSVGCGSAPPPPPPSSPVLSGAHHSWSRFREVQPKANVDEVQAHYVSMPTGTATVLVAVILTDAAGAAKIRTSGRGTISGEQVAGDGRKVEWRCTTSDGKTGTVTLNGKDYKLAEGSLFLVATKGERVAQLKRDLTSVKTDGDAATVFEGVVKGDEEIGRFFGDKGK